MNLAEARSILTGQRLQFGNPLHLEAMELSELADKAIRAGLLAAHKAEDVTTDELQAALASGTPIQDGMYYAGSRQQ